MTYTLLFPFELMPGEELTSLLDNKQIGNLTFAIEKQNYRNILKIDGFETERAARDYVNHIWAVFAWLLVNTEDGLPFNISLEFGHAYYPPDPKVAAENFALSFGGTPVEGDVVDVIADGDLPFVYRTDQKIKRLFGGKVGFTRTRNVGKFVSTLEELSTKDISKIVKQPKLKLALELYNAFFYEKSDNAKFITLIMVLETLTTSPEKHKVSLELIVKWKEELNKKRNNYNTDTDEHESLTALERELLFRKEASLRSQIRALILDTLKAKGGNQALEYSKQAVNAYDLRGKLVHNGWLPPTELSSAIENIKVIAVEVLKAKMLEEIQ
jgi:hypothetical protein